MANTRGRQVVLILTNKSGGSVAAGDVVVFDTTADESFTTTTTGRAELSVGVAQETIANNAAGRVLVSGYAALVNVPSSRTRGEYLETHTVVKQATGSGTRRSGSFGQYAKTSATPSAWLWGQTDQAAASASGSITASGYTQTTARLLGRTTAATGAIEEITVGSGLSLAAGALTATGGSAGALVLLETQPASASATLDFTTFISSTYDEYLIEISHLMPATTNTNMYLRMGTGAGPTWDSGTNYAYSGFRWAHNGSAVAGASSGLTYIGLDAAGGVKSDAVLPFSGSFRLFAPQNTTAYKRINGQSGYVDNAGSVIGATVSGLYLSATAVTGVRFLFSSGNITSGIIRVYGIAK